MNYNNRFTSLNHPCISGVIVTAAAAKSLQSCPTLCDPILGYINSALLGCCCILFVNILFKSFIMLFISERPI